MADIPTGHFVAITGGSFLLGSLFAFLFFKLLKFKLPIKMFGGREARQEIVETRPTKIETRRQIDRVKRSVYQAYLKVPHEKTGIARHLVYDFRGNVIREKVSENGYYSVLDVSVSPSYWKGFLDAIGRADYVSAAYGHYGSKPGPVLKSESREYERPKPISPERLERPKKVFYELKQIATGRGWGPDEVEIFDQKDRFLSKLYDYGLRSGLIRPVESTHPQYDVKYTTSESDPVIDFLIHWSKAELYGTLYKNLVSNPEKGRMMLEKTNEWRDNVPFKNVEEVRIELERHKNYAMRDIKEGFVEKNKKRILDLIKRLSGDEDQNN